MSPTDPKSVPSPSIAPGTVRVQKAQDCLPDAPAREKQCSVCGRTFLLTPDQKFFMCPDCYQKDLLRKKATRRRGTQVLIQIQCPDCGATDYVEFVPQDPGTTYCRPCFERRRREPKDNPEHS